MLCDNKRDYKTFEQRVLITKRLKSCVNNCPTYVWNGKNLKICLFIELIHAENDKWQKK